jgi:phenylpropionate dioxygenase-like ring-hydroxylating dioxygenase large terminal subunit
VNPLLNPGSYTGVRQPLLEAATLPPACYYDAEFYQREIQRIFTIGWVMVGRLDQIPNRGDYFTVDFADLSLIVIRDNEGAARAFGNSCRHRGAR